MALSGAIPTTKMEAVFGRIHNSWARAFGARPNGVETMIVDGMAADRLSVKRKPCEGFLGVLIQIFPDTENVKKTLIENVKKTLPWGTPIS